MPPALIAALPIILAGAGTGITAYEAFKPKPSAPTDPNAAAEAAQQKAAAATTEKEAIARQAPDLQTQLGGAVAPDYYASLAEKNAGYAGDTNQGRDALSTFFGGTAPTSLTGPGSTPPGSGGGKSIFEDLISQSGGGGDDKGASGGFTGV